jgi:hypothetical protein
MWHVGALAKELMWPGFQPAPSMVRQNIFWPPPITGWLRTSLYQLTKKEIAK